MIFELAIDARYINKVENENNILKKKAQQVESDNVQVIEINDNRAEPESYFTPF